MWFGVGGPEALCRSLHVIVVRKHTLFLPKNGEVLWRLGRRQSPDRQPRVWQHHTKVLGRLWARGAVRSLSAQRPPAGTRTPTPAAGENVPTIQRPHPAGSFSLKWGKELFPGEPKVLGPSTTLHVVLTDWGPRGLLTLLPGNAGLQQTFVSVCAEWARKRRKDMTSGLGKEEGNPWTLSKTQEARVSHWELGRL